MRAFDLHLALDQVTPRVWRVIRVPIDLRLDDLHHAIQAVMGWHDFHPHVFEIAEREYGPRPEVNQDAEDETLGEPGAWAGEDAELTVHQALTRAPTGFTYIYDFTEEWRVRVSRLADAELDASAAVVCVAGEHGGPQQESREFEPFTTESVNRRLRRALRPRATAAHPAGPGASADQQLLANLTLVVLFLGSHRTQSGTREAWKTMRFEILDALTEAGLVDSDPRRKAVLLTDAGVAQAERLLQRLRSL